MMNNNSSIYLKRYFGEICLTMFLCLEQARGSCASFVFGFVTFMSIGGFPSFVEDMKVSLLWYFTAKASTNLVTMEIS